MRNVFLLLAMILLVSCAEQAKDEKQNHFDGTSNNVQTANTQNSSDSVSQDVDETGGGEASGTENLISDEARIADLGGAYHMSPKARLSDWHQRDISFSTEIPFNASHLVSTVWYQPVDDPVQFSSLVMVFFSDSVFYYGTYQSGYFLTGKYEYKDGEVVLSDYEFHLSENELEDYRSVLGPFDDAPRSIFEVRNDPTCFYSYSIQSVDDPMFFAAGGSKPQSGSDIKIWGEDAVRLDEKGQVTGDSQVYIKPTVSEESVYLGEFGGLQRVVAEDGTETLEYLTSPLEVKKGQEIHVLGISAQSDFLFCRVPVHDEFHQSAVVWIPANLVILETDSS